MSDTDDAPLDTPDERVAASRRRVLAKLPSLRVGDVWWLRRGLFPVTVTITGWKSQEDYAIPWPMVEFTTVGGQRDDVGAPAFMFGELVTRGAGAEWMPTAEEQAA